MTHLYTQERFKQISAVVVWYKPEQSYIRNLKSYSKFLGHTWVIDNSVLDHSKWVDHLDSVSYISLKGNYGIAHAINRGCSQAIDKGYKFILTMDQDSSFKDHSITKHIKDALILFRDPLVTIVAPIFDTSCNPIDTMPFQASAAISSGNLLRLSAWNFLGGLETKFFMDQIDHEFCMRIQQSNFKIFINPSVYMEHKIGNPITKRILGKEFTSTNHYWGQRYYFMRNSLYIRSKYPKHSKALYLYIKDILILILTIILLEKDIFRKLLAIFLGVFDFIFNRFGSLQDNHPIFFKNAK